MSDYDDDRRGCMRVHISAERGNRACNRYSRDELRAFAKAHGLGLSHLRKTEIAWFMADRGLIDAEGYLRDGFPTPTPPTTARREDEK